MIPNEDKQSSTNNPREQYHEEETTPHEQYHEDATTPHNHMTPNSTCMARFPTQSRRSRRDHNIFAPWDEP